MYQVNTLQAECYPNSLTSTDGRTSRVLLDYVMPWIKNASFAQYNTHHYEGAGPQDYHDQPEVWKLYCAIDFVTVIEASKIVTIKVKSWS